MTRVKICGITNPGDARVAAESGADAIGLVFAESPRRVTTADAQSIVAALPPFVTVFGVFMNQAVDEIVTVAAGVRLDVVQLHGDEPQSFSRDLRRRLNQQVAVVKRIGVGDYDVPERLWKRVARHTDGVVLLDPGAGGGKTFRWELVAGLNRSFILSGGLTPNNVAESIRIARPFGVDVSSGVEKRLRKKDKQKVRAFVDAVRDADRRIERSRVGRSSV